ncbi:MAG: hypothetical protein EU551_02100 [Promethearchaeota archaeon]|nr:MAG: hypothetical protein EU551_02100 [Candidatus Lokiarchaeota archaeon]
MHFLIKVFKNEINDAVHEKFVRYSMGKFHGPRLEFSIRGDKLYFYVDRDYDKYFLDYMIENLSTGEYQITGNLISQEDTSAEVEKLGFEAKNRKSRGINKISIKEILEADIIREKYEKLIDFGYPLLTISPKTGNKLWKITMKKSIPRPSGKKEDDDKKPNFCKGNIPDKKEFKEQIIEDCLLDFKDKAKELEELSFKQLSLENVYDIKEIVLPDPKVKEELINEQKELNKLIKESKKKDIDRSKKSELKKKIKEKKEELQERSEKFRLSTKRKGNIIRKLIIDDEITYESKFEFIA